MHACYGFLIIFILSHIEMEQNLVCAHDDESVVLLMERFLKTCYD